MLRKVGESRTCKECNQFDYITDKSEVILLRRALRLVFIAKVNECTEYSNFLFTFPAILNTKRLCVSESRMDKLKLTNSLSFPISLFLNICNMEACVTQYLWNLFSIQNAG